MKSHSVYFLAIITVMLNVLFFAGASSPFIENKSETKIEVSLEEQGSEEKLDEKLIVNASAFYLKDRNGCKVYDFTIPIVDQHYLNNIFKPPIFS